MKILVTGSAGSGKTTVSEALKQRGYLAYDADEGFGHWIHKKSAEKQSSRPAANRADYYWVWATEKIDSLLEKTGPATIFFCGLATNQARVYKDFDKIAVLNCDLVTIKHRLKCRDNNPLGKRPGDLDWVIETHNSLRSQLPLAKVIEVDASQLLNKVVDEIIKIADEH